MQLHLTPLVRGSTVSVLSNEGNKANAVAPMIPFTGVNRPGNF